MTVLEAMLAAPPVDRVDRVTAQARQWHFGRTVLSLIALVLVGAGRAAFAVFAGLWLVLTWCGAAVKVGWDDARQAQADRRRGEPDDG